jgi:hypothetical protein
VKTVNEYLESRPVAGYQTTAEMIADGVADGYVSADAAAEHLGVPVDDYRASDEYRQAMDDHESWATHFPPSEAVDDM